MIGIPPYSTRTWKIIGTCAAVIFLLAVVLFTVDRCGTWNFNRGMSKANANLANAINKLANIQDQKSEKEKELANINIEEAVQKERIKEAAKDAEIAANVEREAQIIANQAAANVNAVNAQDFSNTTLANAEKARCIAFPESCK